MSGSYSWLNSKTVAVAIQLFTAYPPRELTSTQFSALLPRPRLRHLKTQLTDGLQLVDVKFNRYNKTGHVISSTNNAECAPCQFIYLLSAATAASYP